MREREMDCYHVTRVTPGSAVTITTAVTGVTAKGMS